VVCLWNPGNVGSNPQDPRITPRCPLLTEKHTYIRTPAGGVAWCAAVIHATVPRPAQRDIPNSTLPPPPTHTHTETRSISRVCPIRVCQEEGRRCGVLLTLCESAIRLRLCQNHTRVPPCSLQ
jgi:hypothetical protein